MTIDLAAEIVPDTTSGLPPVETEATTPPIKKTHLPAIKISGGVHYFNNRPPIIFAAPMGVELSTMSLTSRASPTPPITGPT